MNTVDHGHRHSFAALTILFVNPPRLAGHHDKAGFVLARDVLAVNRDIADTRVGVLDEGNPRREIAAAVLFRGVLGRKIKQIDIVAGYFHLFDRRPIVFRHFRIDKGLESLGENVQKIVFLDTETNGPLAPIADDLTTGLPTGMTFYRCKKTGLTELVERFPFDRRHIR